MKYVLTISIFILSFSYFKYYQSEKRFQFTLSEKKELLEKVENQIALCEKIGRIKNRVLEYYTYEDFHRIVGKDVVNNEKDVFKKYQKDLDYAFYKFNRLTQHNMTILDKWKITKDKINGELLFGTYDDIRIVSEAQELFVNSKKIKMNDEGTFKIASVNEINLEYKKYTFDFCMNKIDTFSISRNISIY